MTSPPWMPLYVGDFIADTMHLNATQTGIYIRLLMHCWQHHVIPRDDATLCRIGHCEPRQWHFHREIILAFFQPVDAFSMQHRRVTYELARSLELSNKRKRPPKTKVEQSPLHSQSHKKVSKSLPSSVTRQSEKPPKAASDKASKGHSLQASESLARSLQKRGRR